jgi:hypothetical protein
VGIRIFILLQLSFTFRNNIFSLFSLLNCFSSNCCYCNSGPRQTIINLKKLDYKDKEG